MKKILAGLIVCALILGTIPTTQAVYTQGNYTKTNYGAQLAKNALATMNITGTLLNGIIAADVSVDNSTGAWRINNKTCPAYAIGGPSPTILQCNARALANYSINSTMFANYSAEANGAVFAALASDGVKVARISNATQTLGATVADWPTFDVSVRLAQKAQVITDSAAQADAMSNIIAGGVAFYAQIQSYITNRLG
jgi:hypothetical protein